MPPIRISKNPKRIRLSTFSRNTIHAMTAVATASRFSSRDAALAGVVISPSRRKIGPATPPVRMAPASQGASLRETGVSFCLIPHKNRIARRAASPNPEPRYKRPATSTGSAAEMASLAKGVLAPKSNAAAIALVIPLRGKLFIVIFPGRMPPKLCVADNPEAQRSIPTKNSEQFKYPVVPLPAILAATRAGHNAHRCDSCHPEADGKCRGPIPGRTRPGQELSADFVTTFRDDSARAVEPIDMSMR